jgi:hypothetical protein
MRAWEKEAAKGEDFSLNAFTAKRTEGRPMTHAAGVYATLDDWIAHEAIPFSLDSRIYSCCMRRPELVAKSDESRYLDAVHYAVMARQLLNFHATLAQTSHTRQARLLGIRAAMMAENLAYIVSHEQGRGNVLVFAHNTHLKRGKVQWQWGNETVSWWPVGSHLHELFGRRYVVIGSAVGESLANGIGQPEAGTLEARFTSAPGPVRFIPTHQRQGLPASEIAALPIRSGSMKNPSYFALSPESFTDFDYLAVFDSTDYAHGGWPLEGLSASPRQ